jgi:osmoprotectant transport system ATP-binding protein
MIEFERVSKSYQNGVPVLKEISLSVARGELVVLVGPSGCGKSTLLRLVNRMIEPTAGRILIGGKDSAELDPVTLRRGIGYVIQSIGLFPHMTILENVEVVPSILGTPKETRRERARALLRTVGLEPDTYGARYPRSLSGGQQQRVGIARALAADPEVMLMDEPFSAVDPITRESLQDEFLRIKQAIGKTIVFVTHDIDEAIKIGDRVCVLNAGTVQQFDTPEALLRAPANAFVADFLGEDRALKRLSTLSVDALMRPLLSSTASSLAPDPSLPTLHTGSSARDALSKLLETRSRELRVVNASGAAVGVIALEDFNRTPAATEHA